MKIGSVDLSNDVLVIAEIGNNHEGDVALAERLITLAADAGAQAVKFQTIVPEQLVASNEENRLRQLGRFALTRADHDRLAAVAERAGTMFLSTPFCLEAVDWLEPIVPAFKIASGDNDFAPLLERVAESNKPVILSTGMSDLASLEESTEIIRRNWSAKGTEPGLALLHCVSSYPTTSADANLSAIRELRSLGDAVGYSDHTLGIEAATLAVATGAQIIEKHFTISKNHSDFRDHSLSADPEELAKLVKRVREARLLLGSGGKRMMASEQSTAEAARRSIVAARDLNAGEELAKSDLAWLRPGDGISPMYTAELIGRSILRAVRKGEKLTWDVVG